MRPSAAVVEMIGPPGSGKSSLIPFVSRALESQGFTVYSPIDAARPFARRTIPGRLVTSVLPSALHNRALWALFRIFRLASGVTALVVNPKLARLGVWRQLHRPPGAAVRPRKISGWFLRHAGGHRFLTRQLRGDEMLVFDEGFAHRVVQLFASPVEEPQNEDIARYLAAVPAPTLLVHISAPVDVCVSRVEQRGAWGWLSDPGSGDLRRFVNSARLATDRAIEHATALGWPVATVSNNGTDLTHAAEQVEAAITARLSARSSSGAARGVTHE